MKDINNWATQGAAILGVLNPLPSKLKGNMDATTYFIKNDNGKLVCHIYKEGDKLPVERKGNA
jgi:hypothetical protein